MLHLIMTTTPVGPDAESDSLLNLDPFIVSSVIGIIIPFIIAFVTDSSVSVWFKRFLTAVLAAIGGIITVGATDDGGAVISESAVKSAILTIIAAGTTYLLAVRNSKAEAKLNEVGPVIGPKVAA